MNSQLIKAATGSSKFRKREDLQKRIDCYYQSIRKGEAMYKPTSPSNIHANLWVTNPIPRQTRTALSVNSPRMDQQQTMRQVHECQESFISGVLPSTYLESRHIVDSELSPKTQQSRSKSPQLTKKDLDKIHQEQQDLYSIRKKRERVIQLLQENQFHRTFKSKVVQNQRPKTNTSFHRHVQKPKSQYVPILAHLQAMNQEDGEHEMKLTNLD